MDTQTTLPEPPERVEREPLHENYSLYGAEIPDAYELDISEIDVTDPELWRQGKMWDRFARLREEAPLHYCDDSFLGPYWSVTRYDDVKAMDIDHKRFSSSWEHGGIVLGPPIDDFELPMFIAMDEPRHSEVRLVAQPAVAPEARRDFEPLIRKRTQDLLDSLPVGKPFDWVDTVSVELTTMMLATLFDFPFEDRRKLTRWSDVTTGRSNPDICPDGEEQWRGELLECLETFTALREEARKQPPKMDFLSLLAHGKDTQNMDPMEFLGHLILLIVGGNDTTRNSMSATVYGLHKYPEELDKVKKNPALLSNLVSEIIRWQTPLPYMRRTALEDVDMHGQTIKKGDQIAMWYVSANRDERFWQEDPTRIIADRKQAKNHIAFGFGIHRCLGNRIGEMQLYILLEEIIKRFDTIEVLEEPMLKPNSFVHGYDWMPVICHEKK